MNKQNAVEEKMMRVAVAKRQAYARMTMQERQDATVRALEAAIVEPAKTVHPVAVQWDGMANVLQGMRKTMEVA